MIQTIRNTIGTCIILSIIGCAQTQIVEEIKKDEPSAKPKPPAKIQQSFGSRFTDYLFTELNAHKSDCDSTAINDTSTEWICAGYSYNHLKFIEAWEKLYSSEKFKKQFALTQKHDWMYFNDENGGIDFYGKGYSIQNNQVLLAFDPSELGREIFVGVNPNILAIFQGATGSLGGTTSLVKVPENTQQQKIQSLVSDTKGTFNCRDFKNQKEAIAFFQSRGFSSTYDPYGLDADNNGIPCESISRNVVSQSSKCPSGKSWVAPYKRKNGTRVRGHCRKRR